MKKLKEIMMYVIWAALTFASIQVMITYFWSLKQNDDDWLLILGNIKIQLRLTCGLSASDGIEVKFIFLALPFYHTAKAALMQTEIIQFNQH